MLCFEVVIFPVLRLLRDVNLVTSNGSSTPGKRLWFPLGWGRRGGTGVREGFALKSLVQLSTFKLTSREIYAHEIKHDNQEEGRCFCYWILIIIID